MLTGITNVSPKNLILCKKSEYEYDFISILHCENEIKNNLKPKNREKTLIFTSN